MDFLSILSLANSVEGKYLGVGYGRGGHIKQIVQGLKSKQIPKRQFTFYDNFKEYAFGAAYDFRLDNKIAKHKNIKGEYSKIKSILNSELAILVLNLDSSNDVSYILPLAFKKLKKDGLLYIPQYNINPDITRVVNSFFDSNNLFLNVERNVNYFINSGAFAYSDSNTVKKDTTVLDKVIKFTEKKITPFKDRYEKRIIPKFIPSNDTQFNKISQTKVSKENIVVDKVPIVKTKELINFEDRYEKKVIPKFKPTPVLNNNAKIIGSKVSK